jgi:hypothetical protein
MDTKAFCASLTLSFFPSVRLLFLGKLNCICDRKRVVVGFAGFHYCRDRDVRDGKLNCEENEKLLYWRKKTVERTTQFPT